MAGHSWRVILVATVVLLGAGAAMALQQRGLERGVPNPIITFERARTAERSLEIRSTWERSGELSRAWWNTWLDFLFLTAYTAFAVAVLSWTASAVRDLNRAGAVATGVAWMAVLPGMFDVAENVFLLRIIAFGGLKDDMLPAAAYWLATLKFGVGGLLVLVGVPLALWALVRTLWSRREPKLG